MSHYLSSLIFPLCSPDRRRVQPGKNDPDRKVIAVIGSSVAAGWVTSYKEQYDFKNGWAYRLGRLLEPRGYDLVNVSVPGDTTEGVLKRLEKDLFILDPDYVVIGLSLGNEGIQEKNPEEVRDQFFKGITEIVSQCRARGITPLLGSCYSCDDYNLEQYRHTREMNLALNNLDLPLINLLGALDNGEGHFPKGYTYDSSHPDNRGHEEMFYAVVPGMFSALEKGKQVPELIKGDHSITLTGGSDGQFIVYNPDDVMHSFYPQL